MGLAQRRLLAALVLAAALATTACLSPEAARTRGGGPGADPGNWRDPGSVDIHAPKFGPFVGTPHLAPPGSGR